MASHRAVLAVRKALAAGPGSSAEASADVGRSLTAVAALLEGFGETAAAGTTYREAEALLTARAASASSAGPVRAALADCRSRLGYLLYSTGHARDGLEVLRQARSDQEVLASEPGATMEVRQNWRTPSIALAIYSAERAGGLKQTSSIAGRRRSMRSWPKKTRPILRSVAGWGSSPTTAAACC